MQNTELNIVRKRGRQIKDLSKKYWKERYEI